MYYFRVDCKDRDTIRAWSDACLVHLGKRPTLTCERSIFPYWTIIDPRGPALKLAIQDAFANSN